MNIFTTLNFSKIYFRRSGPSLFKINYYSSNDGNKEVGIPEYMHRPNEPLKIRKARLIYQSRKRGMLENCLILSTFAAKYLDGMTEEQINLYDKLINTPSNDWDIFYWANGNKPTPKEYDNVIMDMLKDHVRNKDKESRLFQPDL